MCGAVLELLLCGCLSGSTVSGVAGPMIISSDQQLWRCISENVATLSVFQFRSCSPTETVLKFHCWNNRFVDEYSLLQCALEPQFLRFSISVVALVLHIDNRHDVDGENDRGYDEFEKHWYFCVFIRSWQTLPRFVPLFCPIARQTPPCA